MNNSILNEFVRQTLQEHGQWLSKRFVANLERNQNIKSSHLKSEMAAFTLLKEGEHGMEVKYNVPLYGRLFEIRGRQAKKNRAAMRREAKQNGETLSSRANRKLKPTAWYAKTMYSGLGRLVAILSAGFSEEQMERIKCALDGVNPDTGGGTQRLINAIDRKLHS